MGRRIKSFLPVVPSLLVPKTVDRDILLSIERERILAQKEDFERRHYKSERDDLEISDRVWIRDLRRWGVVQKRADQPRSFIVQADSGMYRRNRRRLHRLNAFLGYFDTPVNTTKEEDWYTPPQSPEKSGSPKKLPLAADKQEEPMLPIPNEEANVTTGDGDAPNPVPEGPVRKKYPTRDRKKVNRLCYENLGGPKTSSLKQSREAEKIKRK